MKPLPCPFCGKIPGIFPKDSNLSGDAWAEVRCLNKRCFARPTVRDGALVADDRGSSKYKLAAIRRWNKRKS